MEKLSPSMEDYLKEIYRLYQIEPSDGIHVSDIAESMNFSKASVCRATNVLTEKGFLKKDKYKEVFLTEQGINYAEFIVRRHDILTKFLTEILRLDMNTAQRDACGIEHVISLDCYKSISFHLAEYSANI